MPTKSEEKTSEPTTDKLKNAENLATAGFVVAIASIFMNIFSLGLMAIAGLALSIMGRIQTKRAGRPSNLALAGIIISGIVMFLTLVGFVFLFMLFILAGSQHQIDCNAPDYMDHNVCGPMMNDQSAPDNGSGGRLRIDPNTL